MPALWEVFIFILMLVYTEYQTEQVGWVVNLEHIKVGSQWEHWPCILEYVIGFVITCQDSTLKCKITTSATFFQSNSYASPVIALNVK
jgi:hypothetical protein